MAADMRETQGDQPSQTLESRYAGRSGKFVV